METSRIFCHINGTKYYDWTIYWNKDRYRNTPTNPIITDQIVRDLMINPDSLFDDCFVPNHGSEIYVAPGCPVGMADIRKNYVIKRKPDDGVCNVFSPQNVPYYYMSCEYVAVIPSRRSMVGIESCWPRDEKRSKQVLQNKVNEMFPDLTDFEKKECFTRDDLNLRPVLVNESFLSLLQGKLTKPCISYKKLEFKTENEVSLDILYLVYRSAQQQWTSENAEKFRIQLCALNEHNWRDYTGTISMLFNDILNTRTPYKCSGDLGSISRIPKAAKEMVSSLNKTTLPFKSQQDLDMGQKLLMYLIGIPEGMRFTTMETIETKFAEQHIPLDSFYRCFDNMVRLTPKEFKDEAGV